MDSSWKPTHDRCASLTLGVTGWVRWEGSGGEETQVPALLAIGSSWLLSPSLPA